MTIQEIVDHITDLTIKENRPFSKLQEIRAKHGLSPRGRKPFAKDGIKVRYAFHAGGRKELQFNIGLEQRGKQEIFRYGVAFSLQQDNTLHDPKAEFKDAIKRFNKLLSDEPDLFDHYKMWYYKDHAFVEEFGKVVKIDKTLFQAENFIFIGRYFRKRIDSLTNSDLDEVINTLDKLVPLYEMVQFGAASIESRVSRLTWNSHGWIIPSGPYGKSKNKSTHEGKFGYGHEEWLFDIGKLIDGYHYGFLEPIRKQQNAYEERIFNVWLYSINAKTKNRYWIGEINTLEVLDRPEANRVWNIYKSKGWLKEMELQIQASSAMSKGFSNWKGVDLFNVRFLPENLKINEPIVLLPKVHPVYALSRYSFAFYTDQFTIADRIHEFLFGSKSSSNDDDNEVDSKTSCRQPKTIEITYLHERISKSLTKFLKARFGNENVIREHPNGTNRVDIVVKSDDSLIFYEIKTYLSLTLSIREAIGQLFEYSFYPNTSKAKKLVIVTQPHSDLGYAREYLQYLRQLLKLNIYYQYFDCDKDFLSDEF